MVKKNVLQRSSDLKATELTPDLELDLVDIDASMINWASANRSPTARLRRLWEIHRSVILPNLHSQLPASIPLGDLITGRCPPPPVVARPCPAPGACGGQGYVYEGEEIEVPFDLAPCGTPIVRDYGCYGGYLGLADHALAVNYITPEQYELGLDAIDRRVIYRPASWWAGCEPRRVHIPPHPLPGTVA